MHTRLLSYLWRAPMTFLLVYRSVINVWNPPRSHYDE